MSSSSILGLVKDVCSHTEKFGSSELNLKVIGYKDKESGLTQFTKLRVQVNDNEQDTLSEISVYHLTPQMLAKIGQFFMDAAKQNGHVESEPTIKSNDNIG